MVISMEITHANRWARVSVRSEESVEFAEEGDTWCVPMVKLFFLG